MKLSLSVKFILLIYCAKAHQKEVSSSESDVEYADSTAVVEQFGINQPSDGNRIGRIYNGVPATSANQPYAVVIVANSDSGVSQLAGAIINNTQVLTSASGLLSLGNITSMFLYAGSSPSIRAAKYYYHKSYAIHSGFDANTLANDVAIITIDGSFATQTNVKPITISTTELAISTTSRTNCVVLGYGQNADGSNNNILFQADYELITDQECAGLGAKPPSILCARSVKGYACAIDGGAPLVCNNKLYGILTAQTGCTPSSTAKIQKFAKLPVISIPWNPATPSVPTTNLTTPTTNITTPTTNITTPITNTTTPITNLTTPTTNVSIPMTNLTTPSRKNYVSCS